MTTPVATPVNPTRVSSVDAFRGLVMLLMMDSVLQIGLMALTYFSDSSVWATLAFHTDHVAWTGCSLHDLIQPSFSFLVGVSLPFSIANREQKGQGFFWMFGHAIFRGLLLMLLGILLRSIGAPITNWTFMDTLTQIGMGYVLLFLVAYTRRQLMLWIAFVTIVVGYWAAFATYPLPEDEFDYARVNVKAGDPGKMEGFAAHWNKNVNLAADVDIWFLNQFPRKKLDKGRVVDNPFMHERSGYTTLNFIPTLATMILGVIAGMWLRLGVSQGLKLTLLIGAAIVGLGLGELSEYLGICPVVKIIWTPAWVLYSGGWAFAFLAFFYLINDIIGFWHWSWPLLVIGANSIVTYIAYHTLRPFIIGSYKTHFGPDVFKFMDEPYDAVKWEPMVQGAFVLLTLWLMLLWMYRNKYFVRI